MHQNQVQAEVIFFKELKHTKIFALELTTVTEPGKKVCKVTAVQSCNQSFSLHLLRFLRTELNG